MFRALMLAADLLLISQLELTDLPSLLLETHCELLLLFTSFQVEATCGFLKEIKAQLFKTTKIKIQKKNYLCRALIN